jgi:hypothetical protein
MPAPHLTCTAARPPDATPFDPRWRSETVVLLARGIVADSATDRLPVLADALEEAGCDDPATLRHCRECERHLTHCWVLTDVLERLVVPADAPRLTDAEVIREVELVTGRRVLPADGGEWEGRMPFHLLLRRVVPVAVGVTLLLLFGLFYFDRPRPVYFDRPRPGTRFTVPMPLTTTPPTHTTP